MQLSHCSYADLQTKQPLQKILIEVLMVIWVMDHLRYVIAFASLWEVVVVVIR